MEAVFLGFPHFAKTVQDVLNLFPERDELKSKTPRLFQFRSDLHSRESLKYQLTKLSN